MSQLDIDFNRVPVAPDDEEEEDEDVVSMMVTRSLLEAQRTREATLDDRFNAFHLENPQVYDRLVGMARQAKKNGHEKLGIGMLFEVLRWELMLETTRPERYNLDNSYRSRMSRLIMQKEPDLAGIFETRTLLT